MEHQADAMHGDLNSHLPECSKKVSGGRCCEVGVYGDGAGGAGCGQTAHRGDWAEFAATGRSEGQLL